MATHRKPTTLESRHFRRRKDNERPTTRTIPKETTEPRKNNENESAREPRRTMGPPTRQCRQSFAAAAPPPNLEQFPWHHDIQFLYKSLQVGLDSALVTIQMVGPYITINTIKAKHVDGMKLNQHMRMLSLSGVSCPSRYMTRESSFADHPTTELCKRFERRAIEGTVRFL